MVRVNEETEIPDSGAVFTFGKSKFADNVPSKFWIRNDVVVSIVCGDEHTILTTENGRIYVFGTNDWGQLGLGRPKNVSKPTCLKDSGKLYAFGGNGEAQLGLGDTVDRPEPCVVNYDHQAQIKMMSAGSYHSAILTADGKLYTFGSNSEGQLGLGDVKTASVPTAVSVELSITAVSCGYYHTAFVADGRLYTFGEKQGGKLGLLDKQLQKGTNIPQCIYSITERVAHVSCGGNHSAALTECGKLYTFGSGLNGQLGLGTLVMETGSPSLVGALSGVKVAAVSCGESHTAIITEQGKLLTCGDGRHGKLGLGNENFSNQFNPVIVSRFKEFFVHQVACGGCHMVALVTKRPNDYTELNEETDVIDETEDLDLVQTSARERRRSEKEMQTSKDCEEPLSTTAEKLEPCISQIPSIINNGFMIKRDEIFEKVIETDLQSTATVEANNGSNNYASVNLEAPVVTANADEELPISEDTKVVDSVQTITKDNSATSVEPDRKEEQVTEDVSQSSPVDDKDCDDDVVQPPVVETKTSDSSPAPNNKDDSVKKQPVKEPFLKQIFSFKRKKNSEKNDGEKTADEKDKTKVSSNKTKEVQLKIDSKDSKSDVKSDAGSATNKATSQSATSKTCSLL